MIAASPSLQSPTPNLAMPPADEEWIQEAMQAREEAKAVARANKATVEENRRRKLENTRRAADYVGANPGASPADVLLALANEQRPRLPFPATRSAFCARILAREQAYYLRLRRRRPAEWRTIILELEPWLQYPVASIVWWDFFGDRIAARRWPDLDDLLARRPQGEVPDADIRSALKRVGYTPYQAFKRLSSKDYE